MTDGRDDRIISPQERINTRHASSSLAYLEATYTMELMRLGMLRLLDHADAKDEEIARYREVVDAAKALRSASVDYPGGKWAFEPPLYDAVDRLLETEKDAS